MTKLACKLHGEQMPDEYNECPACNTPEAKTAGLDATLNGALAVYLSGKPDWTPSTVYSYDEMFGAVPPEFMNGTGFVAGEAYTINAKGEDVFLCFRFVSRGVVEARYATVAAFKEEMK